MGRPPSTAGESKARRARIAVALCIVATPASAQSPPSPTPPEAAAGEVSLPLADTLYRKGKELMAAGRYAEACEDFAESQRLDPATGGTLLNLAVCHEKMGRIATAAAEFDQARAMARHFNRPDREEFAAQHAAALRPRVSTLAMSVAGASPDEKVLVDRVAVPRVAWAGVPIDPGDHEVSASGPGKVGWSKAIRIGADRESRTVEVPALEDVAPLPALPSPASPVVLASVAGPAEAPTARGLSTRRIVGLTMGAAGLAGIAVGAAFGVAAIDHNNASEQGCPSGRCTQAAATESQRALADANVSNVCVIAGLGAVAAGTVLFLLGRRRAEPPATASAAASLVLRGATIGLGGVF